MEKELNKKNSDNNSRKNMKNENKTLKESSKNNNENSKLKSKSSDNEKKVDILEKTINERKKLPKELKDRVSNFVFFNVVLFMFMMIVALTINIMFNRFSLAKFEETIKIVQITVCLISIAIYEFAYKKDSFKIALYGIEFTIFSIAILYVPYMFTLNNMNFLQNILISFVIYYILKSLYIVIYERNKYLKENISDVKEIVKEEKKGYLDEESKKTLKESKKKK